jgi:hypothetical protein
MNEAKITTKAHRELFDVFLRTHSGIDAEEARYFKRWTEVLQYCDSVILEVSQGERLTGFVILSCFGRRMATYAYGFFDNSVAGTSDLAHGAMIVYCRESGFQELDLGYSIHPSLLRYKMKWGAARCVPPPWSLRWVRHGGLAHAAGSRNVPGHLNA